MPIHRKKRKFEMGRQPSMTKLGEQKVVRVRGRGSGYKYRALKLNEGNFMWVSEGVSRKCKILEVLYNASNNELVRTQTLVKNCIVSVDPTPFKYYWYIHYSEVKINRLPEIKDEDIRVDTFCSSGPGGQGVNTTYSAVRITHLPTNIVVTCQNERSQLKNKATCLNVLKSKLIELELKRQESEIKDLKGDTMAINFGSQIRSYVFCPYTLVKDHRTGFEMGNINAVMDGDIEGFMLAYLKYLAGGKNE